MSRPVLGFIGRLREQKGIDIVLEIVDELMAMDVGLIILGEGDLGIETMLGNLVEQYPGQLAACIGYTEEKSHQIMAGTDIFLMPSRYEPCGLTQLYSLRYGTLPVASQVGGLLDTVIGYPAQGCTGFTFSPITGPALLRALQQAVAVWKDDGQWRRMQERAMHQDFSWQRSAREYMGVYREIGLPAEAG
jgi:starch synthase